MLYIKQLRPPLNEQTDSGAYSGADSEFFLMGGGGGGWRGRVGETNRSPNSTLINFKLSYVRLFQNMAI